MAPPDQLDMIRAHIARTIQRATDLIADLEQFDDGFQTLIPSMSELTKAERASQIATLCGFDENLPAILRQLVESLADVLAGLTTADGGMAWLQHQLARLETGEEPTAE